MHPCKLCDNRRTTLLFEKFGSYAGRSFAYHICRDCGFIFIIEPYQGVDLYDDRYYAGLGADSSVNYHDEFERHQNSIRMLEYRGILALAEQCRTLDTPVTWLDFGCGACGLLRYLQQTSLQVAAEGYDESAISRDFAGKLGLSVMDRDMLRHRNETYDIVTAIEVFEHIEHPREVLELLYSVLKPGGFLIYTTGNRNGLIPRLSGARWSYLLPEVHISIFNDRSMARVLTDCGFSLRHIPFNRAWSDIVKFKLLKGMRKTRYEPWMEHWWFDTLASVFDKFYGISRMPVAMKPESD